MADDFLTTYAPLANDIATRTGIDPSVVLGIIDTETGHGQHVSGNNIFGISPSGAMGQYVAGYPDVQTASNAFISLMQTPRYARVAAAPDPASQAAMLVRSGYNTANPNYASIVAGKALNYGKQLGYQDQGNGGTTPASTPDYNTPSPAGAPAQPPASQPPAPASTTDKLIQDLQQPSGTSATPPAQTKGTQPPSATDQLIEELQKPSTGGFTGPKTDPTVAEKITAPGNTDLSQGYVGPDGSYVPPQAVPSASTPKTPYSSILPIFPAPAPGAVGRILEAGREGGAGAPDASGWAPLGVPLGQYVVNPLLEAGGALVRGGQQFLSEAVSPINPQLGRDVAAFPEAFPTGDYGAPEAPPTAQAARNALKRPVTVADITDAIRRSDAAAAAEAPNALVPDRSPAPTVPPPAQRQAPQPGGGWRPVQPNEVFPPGRSFRMNQTTGQAEVFDPTPQPATQPSAAAPQPAGAQVTTEPIPAQTPIQRATNIQKDVEQTAADRAGPALRDDTAYVADIPPRIEAHRDFSTQTALDHETSLRDDPAYKAKNDAIDAERNSGMTDLLRSDMGDANTLKQAMDYRAEASPDKMRVFSNEKPVDPDQMQALSDQVLSLMNGPEGKTKSSYNIFKDIYDSLHDKDGNLETMPSAVYGARKNITNWLEKGKSGTEAGDAVRAVKYHLMQLVDPTDDVIMSGAPKFDEWRQEWQQRSQAVNQQDFLQQYRPGTSRSLWDGDGKLQFRPVQKLLSDIQSAHLKPVHDAQSLTDQQIQNIVNVRNELATKKFQRSQALEPGSPTTQTLSNAARRGSSPLGVAARVGAGFAAHAAGIVAAEHGIPLINPVIGMYQATQPVRQAMTAARREAAVQAEIATMKNRLLSQKGPPNPLQP